MKTIGLTGGIATGKSTVARLLRERGVPVIDADAVAREVVAPGSDGLAAVLARFGESLRLPDGSLDRKALGAIVMADPEARRDLEAITHPRIRSAILGQLAALHAADHTAAVVEAALMVETGSYRLYDALLVVACSPDVQLRRLMAREGFDEPTARRWIASQLPLEAKLRQATAVIWNDADEAALRDALDRAWEQLGCA